MDEKKYQIFISSTFEDLEQARDKAIATILSLNHLPVGMEMFSAGDDEQWEIIKDTIQSSDYYIVIIGHRYGSEAEDGISYTEMEYDFAKENDIPILAFIRDRDVPTKPDERDKEPKKQKKLQAFTDKAKKSKMCDFWKSDDELAKQIAIALPKTFIRQPREGWIRSSKAVSPELSAELAELSKENRELRKSIELLESQIETRKPDIQVELNNTKLIELKIEGENPDFISAFEPISEVPGHLRQYISNEKIEAYNSSIPSKETIEEYNHKSNIFWNSRSNHYPIKIDITNNGNIKAEQVYIDLVFPYEVSIMEKYDVDELKKPKSPIPENPLVQAEMDYYLDNETTDEEGNPTIDLSRLVEPKFFNLKSSFGLPGSLGVPKRIIPSVNLNVHQRTKLDKNTITIKINSILHTRTMTFDDEYILIPTVPGEFSINVSIICEEYENTEDFSIPIIVQ